MATSTQLALAQIHPQRLRRLPRITTLAVCVAAAVVTTMVPAAPSQAAPQLTLAQAQREVAALNARADAAVEAFNSGRIALNTAERKAAAASASLRREQAAMTRVERAMGALAAAAYTAGNTDVLVSLLTTNDPQVFIDQATSLDQISRSRSDQLLALRSQRQRFESAQAAAEAQAAVAADLSRRLAAQKAAVQQLLAEQQAVLSHLRAADRARFAAEQAASSARASRARYDTPSYAGPASGRALAALQEAYRQIGKPYSYGAAGPNAFDCSGLTMWSFAHAGISLPHSAAAQYGYGTHVPASALQPGDLVFFDEGGYIGHVGIYVGGGKMIDAPHSGSYVGVRPLYPGLIGGTRL